VARDLKDFFPVPPAITLDYRGSKTALAIGDMTIYCSFNIPVAFKRGVVQRRLADKVSAMTLRHLSAFGARGFDVLDMVEFPFQLMANLKAAMRDLSNGYDIVQESKYYADVIVKTLEQVDRVIELKWDSVTRMREALQLARDFLFERLVALIRATTDDRHGIVMGEISLQALQELIDTRGLEPTEKAGPDEFTSDAGSRKTNERGESFGGHETP
jgi:hypothetical protein